MEEVMLKKRVWAVIGANQDRNRYGNIIYRKLRKEGFEVYAVNSLYESVEGDKCYKDLESLPKLPDVINMVVPPKRALGVVKEAAKLGIGNIWFQPGTHDDEVIKMAESLGLALVKSCVLVAIDGHKNNV